MMRNIVLLFAALWAVANPLLAQADLLEPDRAFAFEARAGGPDAIEAVWTVADGYYMYRERIRFETQDRQVRLGEPEFPAGKIKDDEFFGRVETYRGQVVVRLPVLAAPANGEPVRLVAHSQGCADAGVCYPPHQQLATVALASADTKSDGGGLLGRLGWLGLGQDPDDDEDEVLDPDDAFVLRTEVVDANTLLVSFDIAPRHYLYRDKFDFALQDAQGVRLGTANIPPGETKEDEFFGRVQVFHDRAEVSIPLLRSAPDAQTVALDITYQGCAEAGVCYPPLTHTAQFKLPVTTTAALATEPMQAAPPSTGGGGGSEFVSEQDRLAGLLLNQPLWMSMGLFFLLGLGLAFTPCVFPMIPILSSIIVGQGEGLTTRKAFSMSLTYVLAMAVTYTVAGVIVGLLGANLQAAFQNPWILSGFAAVFVLLALSMFGFYELQVPNALQSRLTELSNRQRGGNLVGVGVMGMLSALIVGPCVAAPLVGALLVISQTGDAVLGGGALFAMSLGMGVPLLAIGTSAGKLMPRAGGWMNAIKAVFGVLLLAVAIWMLERILPATVVMLLWAVLLIISAVYMGALEPLRESISGWRRLWKGVGLIFLVYGTLLLIGAAAGSRDYLQPLQGLVAQGGGGGGAVTVQMPALEFKSIKSVADLEREVAAAAARNQPVMLDFYADWCVSCKEYEKYTFSDAGVQQALSGVLLLQADVTANDAQDRELLRHFGLIGPPTLLFFGADGEERRPYRLVGFMQAEPFRSHVEQALGSGAVAQR